MTDYHEMQNHLNDVLERDLFFVVGVPKSGTTWMQHLLNGHPGIRCFGEEDLNRLLNSLEHAVNDYNRHMMVVNKKIGTGDHLLFTGENLAYLLITAVGLLFKNGIGDSDIRCIGAKSPVMIESINVYADLFPAARFIHVVRDGRDVSVSAWIRNLLWDEKATRERWPDFEVFVESVSRNWASDIRKARAIRTHSPDRYLEVRYEDLHADFDKTLYEIFGYLGVDATPKTIDRCRESASFQRLSGGRRRGEEDSRSFFRKGIVGDWKNHFNPRCVDAFMRNGGDMLRELGYR